jgi:antitoxin component YwqK of YwqJK toxin-antitoxin module
MIDLVETNILLDELLDKLYDFLLSCDVTPKNKKLETLINSLNDIIAMKKNKLFYGVSLDKNNIVKQVYDINGLVENKGQLPDDILRGYYYYENGKILLDENLRRKLWEE